MPLLVLGAAFTVLAAQPESASAATSGTSLIQITEECGNNPDYVDTAVFFKCTIITGYYQGVMDLLLA